METLFAVIRVFYPPLDLLLGWVACFPAFWAVTAVGVISGVAVILFQKYFSRQAFLAQCKADLQLLKRRVKDAKRHGDRETAQRLQGLIGRISGKYMAGALKPALWTVPLIGIVALWTGDRLGFHPVRPGDTLKVVAHFEDGASGFAHVVPSEGLPPVGPAIAAVEVPADAAGRQARWQVRAAAEGSFPFRVRHADRTYEVKIAVGGRPPGLVKVFNDSTPDQDRLQALEFDLKPTIQCRLVPFLPARDWNPDLQWASLYIWVALACALVLRFALRVQ